MTIPSSKSSSIQPYLNFDGRCDEALEFYKQAIGIKVEMLMRFKEAPDKSMMAPGAAEKVMHASFTFGDSHVMASDGHCKGQPGFQGFHLSLNVPDAATAKKYFDALSQGGEVHLPLDKTFFSPPSACSPTASALPGWYMSLPNHKPHDCHAQSARRKNRRSTFYHHPHVQCAAPPRLAGLDRA
jgi:PhnB protein